MTACMGFLMPLIFPTGVLNTVVSALSFISHVSFAVQFNAEVELAIPELPKYPIFEQQGDLAFVEGRIIDVVASVVNPHHILVPILQVLDE